MLGLLMIGVVCLKLITSLDVVYERPQVTYVNHKFFTYVNLTMRRTSRRSPYYINVKYESNTTLGNNITMHAQIFENLSGGYHPTPIIFLHKLCDFFEHEPYLGQMYAKQFPENYSCPFPPGRYHFKDIVVHLENFPYYLPFTWSHQTTIGARIDVKLYVTATKESLIEFICFLTVTQKPKKWEG